MFFNLHEREKTFFSYENIIYNNKNNYYLSLIEKNFRQNVKIIFTAAKIEFLVSKSFLYFIFFFMVFIFTDSFEGI